MFGDIEPENIWFTGDHHFFHGGILHPEHGSSRAARWSTLDEMNAALLEQWRDTVGPRDVVYSIGDLFFRVGVAKVMRLLRDLSGYQINLIGGNHDDAILRKLARRGELPANVRLIAEPMDAFVSLDFRIDGRQVFMRHFPDEEWPGREQGTFLLHGHSHGNYDNAAARLDVGWDVHGRLLSFEDVRGYFTAARALPEITREKSDGTPAPRVRRADRRPGD
jgi:calcineurin-like phosphoesterase family protein